MQKFTTEQVLEMAERDRKTDRIRNVSVSLRESEIAKLSVLGGGARGKRLNVVAGIRRLLKLVED